MADLRNFKIIKKRLEKAKSREDKIKFSAELFDLAQKIKDNHDIKDLSRLFAEELFPEWHSRKRSI